MKGTWIELESRRLKSYFFSFGCEEQATPFSCTYNAVAFYLCVQNDTEVQKRWNQTGNLDHVEVEVEVEVGCGRTCVYLSQIHSILQKCMLKNKQIR